jgi:fermentation-respiration switch protein FrsA (DUF1100 family)
MKRIFFRNRTIELAGNIHYPQGFDETNTYPALILATPGSSVKEQVGTIYAIKMAEKGFVAVTFDPAYQGESGGVPRSLEDPSVRIEDIRCAIDYLMTLPYIDEQRVGLLGICAGGGYAVNAALTDRRFKAIGTVVAIDIGRTFRDIQTREELFETLEEAGTQRTEEARGAEPRFDPWIPDSMKVAEAVGITDAEVLEAVTFYRESRYRHPNASNRLLFTSYIQLLSFDAFHLVPELLTQPLQVIVGGRRGNTGQYENGKALFDISPAAEKDFFVVEGASHYDMYYKPDYVSQP